VANDLLVGLAGDFLPGTTREEEIMGRSGGTVIKRAPTEEGEEPAKPGSLLDEIQREVDEAESMPVPTVEPL
jgi:outer membrane protein assembly factor BamE